MTEYQAISLRDEERAVQEYNSQVMFVKEKAGSLEIKNQGDMAVAGDLLRDLKMVEKAIEERKQGITRPLMSALASARDLFKPLEAGYKEAKDIINKKMIDFTDAEEARIAKEQSFVEGRLERGTIKPETAIKKMEDIGEIKHSFDGGSTKTIIKKLKKIRITDESMIPREYLVPDMRKITDAILRDGEVIPGVEVYEEKSITSKGI